MIAVGILDIVDVLQDVQEAVLGLGVAALVIISPYIVIHHIKKAARAASGLSDRDYDLWEAGIDPADIVDDWATPEGPGYGEDAPFNYAPFEIADCPVCGAELWEGECLDCHGAAGEHECSNCGALYQRDNGNDGGCPNCGSCIDM